MAQSSGNVDFSVTRDDIITEALKDLGVMAAGDTTSSASFTDHSASMALKLNMLVKQWSGQSDFSPGIKMWSRKTAYLFLQKGQAVYTLGPTVSATSALDKFASSYVTTTIGATEASGQTVLTMTDGSIFANTNRIGIQLDTGAIQWTTVSGTPAGNDVTVAVALTAQASAGNRVFGYATTAQGRRPLEIMTVVRRDVNGIDTPMDPISRYMYEEIGNKGADGTPTRFHYSGTLIDGTLYLDIEPTKVTDVLRIGYLSPIEDFDAATDLADYDAVWFRALCNGLKLEACGMFGQEGRAAYFKALRDESLAIAKNAAPEMSDAYFQPNA